MDPSNKTEPENQSGGREEGGRQGGGRREEAATGEGERREETGRAGEGEGGGRRPGQREEGGDREGGERREKIAQMREAARVSQLNPKTLADEIICSSAKDKNFVGYTSIRRLNLLNSSAKTLKFVG